MKTVKVSDLGELKSAFDHIDENENAHQLLEGSIGTVYGNVEFAKPILKKNEFKILWQANTNDSFIPLTEVDNQKVRDVVSKSVKEAVDTINERISNYRNKTYSFANKVVQIPAVSSILVSNNSPKIQVVVTEWGFIKDQVNAETDIIAKLFEKPEVSILVRAISESKVPVSNVYIALEDHRGNITHDITNDKGLAKLGSLVRGESFTVSSTNSDIIGDNQFVADSRDTYDLIVRKNVKLGFTFKNKDGFPIPNFGFSFSSSRLDSIPLETDSAGQSEITHDDSGGDFYIQDHNGDKIFKDHVPTEDSHYEILVDIDEEVPDPGPIEDPQTMGEFERIDGPVLKFVNYWNKPVKAKTVRVVSQSHTSDHLTDSQGEISDLDLVAGHEYSVEYNKHTYEWTQRFIPESGVNTYEFKRPFFFRWWWIPILLLFFLLFSCFLGCCKCDDMETHQAVNEEPPPSGEVFNCSDAESHSDEGNNTIYFDLGEDQGEFLFEYYNLNELDIIQVYCDQSNDLLYEVNFSTGTDYFAHSEVIDAPCRYIRVDIIGNSVWGIKVNCP